MVFLGPVLAYFTPETTLPVATMVSAILGFGLLIVRAPLRAIGKGLRRAARWAHSRLASTDL